ncbi:MAG: transketolase [bacterium]|nr:transketolase [bacterium]
MSLEELCVNTIRTLSMDAVQKANSGHPGAPMALAPIAYLLWAKVMRYNPKNPAWFDRDRFVLSCGHASMLLYSALYLSGYDLSLDDLKDFRQWESKTPGHPEYGLTPGVETTTGPLGQGVMNAVGMAMAEAHMAAVYNREGHEIVHHDTYAICSDGDLMEGASHEAASLAGHLGLGKLICIYDDNRVTIDGGTELAFSDDAGRRFEGYGWHVQNLGDRANDLPAMEKALEAARAERGKPSLVIIRSHIGFGSPNKQDTADAHGAPLGEEEVRLTKQALGWPADETFLVPERALSHMRAAQARGTRLEEEWDVRFAAYRKAHPDLAAQLEFALAGDLPAGWEEAVPVFTPGDGALASRAASGKVLNAVAEKIPWLIGGSADLAPSNNSLLKCSGDFAKSAYANRNLRWGVREHIMCAASSGIALHGGLRPYCATFFVFTDYARPAIRLAALMGLPVIYVMTHDSIGLGEDGPTHQPVEHLAALRAIPNLCVIRPADAGETACAWRVALKRKSGPTMFVLSRQGLPTLDREKVAGAEGLRRGAYVLSEAEGSAPDVILIGSGSEVSLLLEAKERLAAEGTRARVVSMPCWELFREQDAAYRESVLPVGVKARLGVEAGVSLGWHEWIGDGGDFIGIDRFGASAPAKENFKQFGFTADNVAARAKRLASK